MDVEAAASQIDVLIERRSKQKEEANEQAAMWRCSEAAHKEKLQKENRDAWADFHAHMHALHVQLAVEHEEQYAKLTQAVQPAKGIDNG